MEIIKTNQQKKEYLKEYLKLSRQIDRKIEELYRWQDLGRKITTSYSDMPKGGGGADKIQSAVEMVDKLRIDLQADITKLAKMRWDIHMALDKLSDDKLKAVLEYRYIHGLDWEEISDKMQYDIDSKHIFKLHGQALFNINITLNDTY